MRVLCQIQGIDEKHIVPGKKKRSKVIKRAESVSRSLLIKVYMAAFNIVVSQIYIGSKTGSYVLSASFPFIISAASGSNNIL